MQQTTNYQLNQWDASDRIMRTDFNADNSKIDSGLKTLQTALEAEQSARGTAIAAEASTRAAADTTEANARAAADASLQSAINAKNAFTLLKTVTTTAQANQVDVDVSDIPWSSYQLIVIDNHLVGDGAVTLKPNGLTCYYYNPAGTYQQTGGLINSFQLNPSPYFADLRLLFLNPSQNNSYLLAKGLAWPPYDVKADVAYSALTTLQYTGTNSSYFVSAGSTVKIWGVN